MGSTGAVGAEGAGGGPVVPSVAEGVDRPGGESRALLWWPRWRGVVLDGVLALASAVECAVEGASFAGRVGMPVPVFVVVGLVVGASLLVRRRWPVAVVLISVAVSPAQMGVLLTLVGLYSLAAAPVARRILLGLAGLTTVATFVVSLIDMRRDHSPGYRMPLIGVVLTSVLVAVGVTVAPLLLGLYIGARRRLVESLIDRADGLERELALLAEKALERAHRARIEERTRIAREMHDVVAHRVSLMVVHAGALQSVARRDPDRAARNAELLADMGRQALDELRQMLGVLRANEEGTVAPGLSLAAVALREDRDGGKRGGPDPEGDAFDGGPVLGDVRKLVEESRAAGMAVDLRVEGEERPLAAQVERTAYRVVQEALTNVHKHAPGARTLVRVAYREEEVAVLVENGPSDGRPSAALPSGGNGLVGMRERVVALGGGFAAGPGQNDGFRVSAMLPDADTD
jgi:signal transduction histidine kinase